MGNLKEHWKFYNDYNCFEYEFFKKQIKNTTLIEKSKKDINLQMANKHMKRYSTLLIKTYKHDI